MKRSNLKLTCATLAIGILAFSAKSFAVENYRIPLGEIRQACAKYLNAYASVKDIRKMEKKLRDRVETKIEDQGIDEDTAMRHIMLDWAAGNAKKLEEKNPKVVKQACFYFIRFCDKGYQIPGQMRSRLTRENTAKLIDWLETEAAKVQQLAAK
jgi:hypothetical protein